MTFCCSNRLATPQTEQDRYIASRLEIANGYSKEEGEEDCTGVEPLDDWLMIRGEEGMIFMTGGWELTLKWES